MKLFLLPLLVPLLAALLTGVPANAATDVASQPPLVSISEPPPFIYPQRREFEGYTLVLHGPQIRAWPGFATFEAIIAIELTPPDGTRTRFGTATVTGATTVDRRARIVRISAPVIGEVSFAGGAPAEYVQAVQEMATRSELDVPLDLYLAALADDVLSNPPPAGFNTAAPAIHVVSKPTLMLVVESKPVFTVIPDTGLQVVANANWPVFRDAAGDAAFYMLYQDLWLTSKKLDGGWKKAKSLPAGFGKLPAEGEHSAVKSAVPWRKSALRQPKFMYADQPAELIVTDGKAKLEAIGLDGLEYVKNTESPLFRLEKTWYHLVAGRWFTTANLAKGPWAYTAQLPGQFAAIPPDHARAFVRASVPGTIEARMAALEALLPVTAQVPLDAILPVEVTYAGAPEFEPVPGTGVARAVNSGFDVIRHEDLYYLCYAGVWYVANAPTGAWQVAASVPDAIYAIPPSSPAYHVTQVTVVESTPSTVVYTYPPSYSSSVYVVYGVPYYGTGWYYPPYIYGGYYYPYWGSYGHGSWYNPATGNYGSRSVWYGPYGGYSYNEAYNPSTGRYGYMETAWDSNEWASHGGTYNPRTGVGTETSRYYNENSNASQMERTVARGDDWVHTERERNFNDGTSNIERSTSGGGSSEIQREFGDGTMSSEGSITTGDGRTASVSGERTRDGGSSTISGESGSIDMTTKRQDGRSITAIEGSGGGQGISMSGQGPGRTTIGQSGNGDLYAGHDGNVYKKTEDGWQHYEDGGWQSADVPERSGESARQQGPSQTGARDYSGRDTAGQNTWPREQGSQRNSTTRPSYSRDTSQLNRDYSARQRGAQQYQQRGGGFQGGGGFQRGNMQRGGRGGARRR